MHLYVTNAVTIVLQKLSKEQAKLHKIDSN